ncbi:twin transmembrane helix small protein [Arenibacterium halophilum]|uniref:Twin transmembrane helix small protein n=1 Tax=Arenibacterium halophilum TaxID=2583821 RepID=A0ABY2XEL4_9RHOB|nr:twin transmembrane helix small protein [Arenibacterium halophilum]MEC7259632.1 twin transmembrane helix small protein [Pseudomonadota bacterium]TMV15455.1 twin transmembrane helix small protein [Arenibacterium halophilum]
MTALYILILVLLAGVVAVLAFGVGNFGREGEKAAKRSNKAMQLRILLQGLAVLAVLLFVFLKGTGN